MMENRFVISKRKSLLRSTMVITDTKTGVQYLYVRAGYSGGLTLLVDTEGKPLIERKDKE